MSDVFGFETKGEPLAARSHFLGRLAACILAAGAIIAVSVSCGMLGYRHLEGLSWTDAFLNAALVLSGMGHFSGLESSEGKVFAGIYALVCGLVVVVATGIALAPVVHRLLHRFHLDEDDATM